MNKGTIQSILTAVMLVALIFLGYQHFAGSGKLGYVDANVLLNEYEGMIEARKQYEAKAMTWQANIDTLTQELEEAIGKHEAEAPKMSQKELSLSKELLQTKRQQLMQYQQAIQQKAQEEDQRMTQEVLQEVNAYIKQYGEKHGYQFIFTANSSGSLAFAEESLDLTKEIIKGLNGK